jgi:hypothetical protein
VYAILTSDANVGAIQRTPHDFMTNLSDVEQNICSQKLVYICGSVNVACFHHFKSFQCPKRQPNSALTLIFQRI